MKKITPFLLLTLTLLFVVTSCSDDKDDPIIEKGDLISATFSPTTNKFTLKYSKGATETVDAIIDNTTTPPSAKATLEDGTIIMVKDATVEGKAIIETLSGYKYVNDWIFEEMNIYYLWNKKIPKNPNFDLRPEKFFGSLLNKYDPVSNPDGDRFSWIQEDYTDLLGSLSGVSSDEIGFEYTFVRTPDPNQYYAIVTYPKIGSDAYHKGIDRGRFITAVDGKNITPTNYRNIFSGTGSKSLTMADFVYNSSTNKYDLTSSGNVSVKMEKNFAEKPIQKDSVYTINGKKIGYLVYNFFATDKGDKSHDYDKLLMNTLSEIKAKGATEFILDLRYNGGGAVSSAIALASALVKERSTNNVLVKGEYNDLVHAAFKKQYGADYNIDYFIDKIEYDKKEIAVPALNLPRLYVLVTRGSASASELVINGLKPYMDVVLIGETTYGKNVGSISIYEKDDPKNKWGMQPIIVKYYNSAGFSDFTAGFIPNIEIDEFNALELRLVKFGDTEDPLLGRALNEITGGGLQTRSIGVPKQIATNPKMIEIESSNSIFKDKTRFEMYDDTRGEQIKKLMKK